MNCPTESPAKKAARTSWRSFGSAAPRSLAMSPSAGSMPSIDMAMSENVSAISAMNSAPARAGLVAVMIFSRMPSARCHGPHGAPPFCPFGDDESCDLGRDKAGDERENRAVIELADRRSGAHRDEARQRSHHRGGDTGDVAHRLHGERVVIAE